MRSWVSGLGLPQKEQVRSALLKSVVII